MRCFFNELMSILSSSITLINIFLERWRKSAKYGRLFRFCGPYFTLSPYGTCGNNRIQMTLDIPPYQGGKSSFFLLIHITPRFLRPLLKVTALSSSLSLNALLVKLSFRADLRCVSLSQGRLMQWSSDISSACLFVAHVLSRVVQALISSAI